MRLLLINYELPPIGGGGGRATLRLAREFVRAGHPTAILTSAFDDFPRDEEKEGIRIRRIPVWRPYADRCPPRHMLTFVASSLYHAPRFAKEYRPDLVLAFFGIPCGPCALRIKRRLRIPYVLSLRGSDVPRPELGHQRFLESLALPVLRRVWLKADGLVAVGEGLRQAALAVEPGLRIEVIPNGVDVEAFAAPAERRGTGLRLLFVGRLREFKGLQFVIGAMADRVGRGKDVDLDVVGDGPYRAELERLATRYDLNEHIRFQGWLDPSQVPAHYARADALVLPSYVEGSPNVVLEAMAAGLPVIASDAPGIRELVRHEKTGLLTPVGDVEAIGRAIDRLLESPELRVSMGSAGKELAQNLSWSGIARRHLDLFARINDSGESGDVSQESLA